MLAPEHVLNSYFFFFNDTATTEIYTLSLHDALPISCPAIRTNQALAGACSRNGAWVRLPPRVAAQPRAKGNTSCFSLMRSYTRINRHLVDIGALAEKEVIQ